ncbi:MAG: hypothetical protein WCF67_04850 [Chitinophagaceae bacterium]
MISSFIPALYTRLKLFLSIRRLSLYVHYSLKFTVRKRRDGIYLGCFKVLLTGKEDYEVLYNGLTFWTKRDEDQFEFFLRKIRDNGGMERFETKADNLFAEITPDTMDFLKDSGYGFDFYDSNARLLPTNTDLFFIGKRNSPNIVIARLGTQEVETFIRFHRLTNREKSNALRNIIQQKLNSPNRFNPKPSELIFGETIPVSKNGLAPDYNADAMEPFLYAGDKRNAQIKIEMSGNMDEDFRRAFKVADVDMSDPTLQYFVWHHLDDLTFDSNGLATCTMQLVNKAYHKQVILASLKGLIDPTLDPLIAGRHIGSISLWETAYLVYYK